MNTLVDMILVAPFVALLAPGMRWIFWASVCSALLVAEFFSPFSFGLLSLALCAGWLFTRTLITFFNTSSIMSIMVAFVVGITIEVSLVLSLFVFEQGTMSEASVFRGGIFALRQFLAGLFVFALIMGMRAAYAVGIYAVAEEKNPFA
ncbi:MAG: hypothetical protein AAB417_02630 [Patescibacteria group bacterium]